MCRRLPWASMTMGRGYGIARRLCNSGFGSVGDASVYGTLRCLFAAEAGQVRCSLRGAAVRVPLIVVGERELQWHDSTPIVDIGKAAPTAAGSTGLRERLRPFSSKSASHSGGHSIWQLGDADELIVGWRRYEDPPARDRHYLIAFRATQDWKLPFANKNGGRVKNARVRRATAPRT